MKAKIVFIRVFCMQIRIQIHEIQKQNQTQMQNAKSNIEIQSARSALAMQLKPMH